MTESEEYSLTEAYGDKRVRVGKLDKDDSLTVKLDIEGLSIKQVDHYLTVNLAWLVHSKNNAFIGIYPENKEIFLVGMTNPEMEEKNFRNKEIIELKEILKDYRKSHSSKKKLEKIEELSFVATQMSMFVNTFWLRKGYKAFMFIWDNDTKKLTTGLGRETKLGDISEISKSIKEIDTNYEGNFLERDWADKKDLHKTIGSGKR